MLRTRAYVFERELQVLSCSTVPEDKHTTIRLHLLLDDRPDSGAHLLLGDLVHATPIHGSNRRSQHTPYQTIETKCLYAHDVILHIAGSFEHHERGARRDRLPVDFVHRPDTKNGRRP
jgi:hypothetical protein